MQALRLHEIGGPESLCVDEIPVPEIRDGEALIRIAAAALNRRDLFITQGLYPNIRPPVTLGSDGAGTIASLGAVVSDLHVGDDVMIDPMLGWGDDPRVWNAGRSTILGMPHDGTFAQYVAVPIQNVFRKPAHLSMEEAAAIPLAGLTAYRALFTRGALQRGETVLITGVGGGVQSFVLLFAKQAGAQRDRYLEQRRKARTRPRARRRSRHQLRNGAKLGEAASLDVADRSRRRFVRRRDAAQGARRRAARRPNSHLRRH